MASRLLPLCIRCCGLSQPTTTLTLDGSITVPRQIGSISLPPRQRYGSSHSEHLALLERGRRLGNPIGQGLRIRPVAFDEAGRNTVRSTCRAWPPHATCGPVGGVTVPTIVRMEDPAH